MRARVSSPDNEFKKKRAEALKGVDGRIKYYCIYLIDLGTGYYKCGRTHRLRECMIKNFNTFAFKSIVKLWDMGLDRENTSRCDARIKSFAESRRVLEQHDSRLKLIKVNAEVTVDKLVEVIDAICAGKPEDFINSIVRPSAAPREYIVFRKPFNIYNVTDDIRERITSLLIAGSDCSLVKLMNMLMEEYIKSIVGGPAVVKIIEEDGTETILGPKMAPIKSPPSRHAEYESCQRYIYENYERILIDDPDELKAADMVFYSGARAAKK